MMRMVVSTALLLLLVPAGWGGEKRYEFLVSALDAPISLHVEEAPIRLLLNMLEELSSPPGSDREPSIKVKILINELRFKRDGKDFDVDRLAPIKLPGKLSGVTLSTVLKLTCEQIGAVFVVGKEFIELVPAAPFRRDLGWPEDEEHFGRALNPLIHCNYKKMPLAQALEALAEKSGRSIVLSQQVPDETAKKEVNLKLANTPFETAIEFLAATIDLKVVARGDTYLVTTRKQAEEMFRNRVEPAANAAASDNLRSAKPVHFHSVLTAAPAPKNEAATDKQLTVEQIRKVLDSVVNVEASQISLAAFLNKLTEDHKIPFTLDRLALNTMGLAEESIMVDSAQKNVKLRTGLRNVLNSFGLTIAIIGDQVVVTTEEIALHKQFKQRINLELNDVPLNKAMKSLAQKYGVNIVLDPKCVKSKTTETAVTLELDDVALEAAIRLTTEMAGLKAARFGNIIYITTEDRADKINKDGELFPHSHPEFPGGVLPNAPVPPGALAPLRPGIE